MSDPSFQYESIKICDTCYGNLKEDDLYDNKNQTSYLNGIQSKHYFAQQNIMQKSNRSNIKDA